MSKMIQIRDVPDDLHRELKRRAAAEALTLSDYLKRELANIAGRPSLSEWIERVQNREPMELSREDIVSAIRAHRDA
jgi:hypothetical protein